MKKYFFIMLFMILVSSCIFYYFFNSKFEIFEYDLTHNSKAVTSISQLKNIISKYEIVKYNNLPHALKIKMKSQEVDYNDQFSDLEFHQIPKRDIYKKIYLNQRFIDLVSPEQRVRYIWLSSKKYFYILIEEDLYEALYILNKYLKEKNYSYQNIKIISAYRSPKSNDNVHGAPKSMHLYGKALDLKIGDVDNDSRVTSNDKIIVYDILDKLIIKNNGGIGFYPRTMILHIDLRGKKARWTEFKRKLKY